MKRPPGLWILLSAGVLWLSLQDVYGIRATALIFGRSSTTSTTTSPSETPLEEETATNTESSSSTELSNTTKPTLTGNPQIDYVWDPNLPKELNGHNLSSYPFYERVPEEIDFKCDGLHDGFYASVAHQCQVYHHCLFGTRFDFLCANYTAFDQRTFICHFASEVDCANSKNFWHRNDALYVAQSTTTLRPLNLNIYTTPPAGDPITPLALPSGPGGARRPAGGRRPYRPNRRRRPQFEYYDDEDYDDDYYEERPRSNRGRKRPRPRPRPVVYEDDEYEEYEDERYEKKGGNRRDPDRRRPYESRRTESRRRNKDKRKPEYDEDDEEVDERFEDSDFAKGSKRKGDRRPSEKRRPIIEDYEPEVERKPSRKNQRPPSSEEYEDEASETDTKREKPPRKSDKNKPTKEEKTAPIEERPIIKPVSGSIYDRPRVAPRINLPVPKNAANKYSYSTAAVKTSATAPVIAAEEEYYADYEEEPLPPPKRPKQGGSRKPTPPEDAAKFNVKKSENNESKGSRERPQRPDSEENIEKPSRPKYTGHRSKYAPARTTSTSKKPQPASEEYYDDYEEEPLKEQKPPPKLSKKERQSITTSTTSTTTPRTTPTTSLPVVDNSARDKHEPIVRVVKRPFLPSRGGNPYTARGLQPVGVKALDAKPEQDTSVANSEQSTMEDNQFVKSSEEAYRNIEQDEYVYAPVNNGKVEVFKASPVITKAPTRSSFGPPEVQEEFVPLPSRQQGQTRQNQNNYINKEFSGPRTTQKPKVLEKNPLDLNEYDVTLNEALNPTLPNLPIRGFPTGFSSGNDYSYNSYTRPRYDSINSASDSDYAYQNPSSPRQHQPNVQRYQTLNFRRDAHIPSRTQAIYSSYN